LDAPSFDITLAAAVTSISSFMETPSTLFLLLAAARMSPYYILGQV
jgi:hypothetical protein